MSKFSHTQNKLCKAMPQIGAGTFRLEGPAAYASVKSALEVGYRHIDTAQVYNNESEVGAAIADSLVAREDIFVTTKIWMDNLHPDKFIASLRDSLSKLKTSYVDLLLIHWPLKDNSVEMVDYLPELAKAKQLGLTHQIGVSNFTVAQLKQAISILGEGEICTNQVELHPYLQNRDLASFCRANDIAITAYMPFAYADVLKDDLIKEIATKHKATPAQVVLSWVIQQEFASIPSSTNPVNLAANLDYTKVQLSAVDNVAIESLDRNYRLADPDFAPEWD